LLPRSFQNAANQNFAAAANFANAQSASAPQSFSRA